MEHLILITGGARSGKSNFAEELARSQGQDVLYIATALGFDPEMRERIAKHRQRRPANWRTWEGYQNLTTVFDDVCPTNQVILLDCVTLLVSNWLLQLDGATKQWEAVALAELEQRICEEIRLFLAAARQHGASVIMVTNEVGFGIVPENQLARIFRDIAGRVNQYIASRAEAVYLVVCGQPLRIK